MALPAERIAFVLHDAFALSFTEIAAIIDCNEAAARQPASRARRRVQGTGTADRRQRELVEAFFAAPDNKEERLASRSPV